jgi:predicted transcriptional regulator
MASRSGRQIESALLKKGFQPDSKVDHRYLYFWFNGTDSVTTKLSHGSLHKDIDAGLISAMAKQCRLSKNEFLKLIDCSLSEEQYRELL